MDFTDNQAIYLQIADYFCERILNLARTKPESAPASAGLIQESEDP